MNDFVPAYKKTTTAMAVATMRRNFCCWKRFKVSFVIYLRPKFGHSIRRLSCSQIIILSVVVLFVVINCISTFFASNHQNIDPSVASMNSLKYNDSTKWLQYGDTTKYISIEVLSSKDRVRICVDDATVIIVNLFHFVIYYSLSYFYSGSVK